MKPILSIITVCFNSAKYIRRCIESVLPFLNEKVEYLVIDGASDDGTIAIINEYTSQYTFRIISEKDNGIYDAMNKGIKYAKGEYIYFLNSDDYLLPNSIAEVLNDIIAYSKPDCLYGNVIVTETDENGLERIIKTWYGDVNVDHLKQGMICSHQALICRRDAIIQQGCFYTGLKIAADWDLILRLFRKRYSFQYVDITIASFSRGGVSCSNHHEWERHMVRKRNQCYILFDMEYYKALKTQIYNKLHRIEREKS